MTVNLVPGLHQLFYGGAIKGSAYGLAGYPGDGYGLGTLHCSYRNSLDGHGSGLLFGDGGATYLTGSGCGLVVEEDSWFKT